MTRKEKRRLKKESRRWSFWRFLILVILATIGSGVAVFPQIGDFYTSIDRNKELNRMLSIEREELTHTERNEMLKKARQYNRALKKNGIDVTDPFSDEQTKYEKEYQKYSEQLDLSGTSVFGRIFYESKDIDLPIYKNADMGVISKGVGHLYGTALPVGGKGNRPVLVGHSGYTFGAFFSSLHDSKNGDVFIIEVLGEFFYYRVNEIEIIIPDNFEVLEPEPGKDLVTLLTCTPIGINSHRLLVTGERIPADEVAEMDNEMPVPKTSVFDPFQWWILVIIGVNIIILWIANWGFVKKNKEEEASPNESP